MNVNANENNGNVNLNDDESDEVDEEKEAEDAIKDDDDTDDVLPPIMSRLLQSQVSQSDIYNVSSRMARLSISTGVELGLHDRISRVLAPGDEYDPNRTYNCSTIAGLNEQLGIVFLF
jgi:hypothetical protein